jgi:hypothetical protein
VTTRLGGKLPLRTLSLQLAEQILDKFNHLTALDLVAFTLFSQTKLLDSDCLGSNLLFTDHNPQWCTNLLGLFKLFADMCWFRLVLEFRLPISFKNTNNGNLEEKGETGFWGGGGVP